MTNPTSEPTFPQIGLSRNSTDEDAYDYQTGIIIVGITAFGMMSIVSAAYLSLESSHDVSILPS